MRRFLSKETVLGGLAKLRFRYEVGRRQRVLVGGGAFFREKSLSPVRIYFKFWGNQERRIDDGFASTPGTLLDSLKLDWKIGRLGALNRLFLWRGYWLPNLVERGRSTYKVGAKRFVDWLTPLLPQQEKK